MTTKKPLDQVVREIHIMVEFLNDMANDDDESNAEKLLRDLRVQLNDMTALDEIDLDM